MKKPEELDIDSVIERCFGLKGGRPGAMVMVSEGQIKALCTSTREVFLSQGALLELEAPMKICGDIHGQYHDLMLYFDQGGFPPESNYLFLGGYVNHGRHDCEVILLLFAYKVKYPENFFLLRGRHECTSLTRIYGFYEQCKRRYNIEMWKRFCGVFDCMPVCAIIDEKIFCVYGGLSPELTNFNQIRNMHRPTDTPDTGLLCDLLWAQADPNVAGFKKEEISYRFGRDAVTSFLKKHDMDLVVTAARCVEDGYEFFAHRKLVMVWSASNYSDEFDNAGAIMDIDETLMVSFKTIKRPSNKGYGGRGRGPPRGPYHTIPPVVETKPDPPPKRQKVIVASTTVEVKVTKTRVTAETSE